MKIIGLKLFIKKEICDRFKACVILRGTLEFLENFKGLINEVEWNKNFHRFIVKYDKKT